MIDVAQVPERKSKPKRSLFVIVGFALGLLAACVQTGRQLSSRRRPTAAH